VTIIGAIWFIYSYLSGRGIDPFADRREAEINATQNLYNTPLPDYPINTPNNFSASSGNLPSGQVVSGDVMAGGTITPTIYYTPTNSPTPTNTPFPTLQPFDAYLPVGKMVAVGYSYYWPPWGPPNCSYDNWHEKENYCEDTTASGLPWSKYVERAVAVPVEWREIIPLHSVVRIHSPAIMKGDYLVIDYCGDCIKDEGHIYFDFLSARQILAWTVPMMAEVITQ
jgi:hypothetical protein